MKKFFIYSVMIVMGWASSACEITDTNIDPTRQADAALNLILPAAITQTVYNQSANPARISGIIMQHFTGFDAQQLAYTIYNIPDATFDNFWRTGLYIGCLKDFDIIIGKAGEEDSPIYAGIAKVLMAESYGVATTMFGDMPFSAALQGTGDLTPVYDTNEEIINGVLAMLDEAIVDLNAGGPAPGSDDLIYGGDAELWIKTAHALKARYLLQLTKRRPDAAQQALAEVALAYQDATEQSDFTYESGQISNNPWNKFGLERTNTMINDTRFAENMIAKSDPRLEYYVFEQAENQWNWFDPANPTLVWDKADATIPLVSYAEMKFTEAEALQRTGAGAGEVQTALQEAITASMDLIGVPAEDYADYVATQSDLSGLSGEGIIERIIEEAYYAYFMINEAGVWNNYRRTGYPALTPDPEGSNGANPSGGIPRRYLYPNSENSTNQENLNAARARQNGALLDVDIWMYE